MGPGQKSQKLATIQCHSCRRRINAHKATLPTLGCDWRALGDVLERWKQQQHHSRDTQAPLLFCFYYLNGVKHLHKWVLAVHAVDKKSFAFSNLASKKKRISIFFCFIFLNRFCTFCEICSETRTHVRTEAFTLHPPPRKEEIVKSNTPQVSAQITAHMFIFNKPRVLFWDFVFDF